MKSVCAALAFFAASVAAQYGGPSPSPMVQVQIGSSYPPATPIPQQQQYSSNYGGGGYSQGNKEVAITRYNHEISGSTSNSVQFETANGISVSDDTRVVQDGSGSVLKKQGNFAYTSPEGKRISTSWSADHSGFSAQGDHLPKPVVMPADHAAAHQEVYSRVTSSNSGNNYGGSSYTSPVPAMGNSYNAPTPLPAPAIMNSAYSSSPPLTTPAGSNSYNAPAPAPATATMNSYSSNSAPTPSASVIRVQTYVAPGVVRSTAY